MIWVQFIVSSVLIVLAAIKLAEYGDIIAIRTRLGGLFIGTLLIAGATSLPEVLTSINALKLDAPDLAAGNLLGSNMFNMFLLAILDVLARNQRILRKAALKHALSGSLTILMIVLVVFFIVARLDFKVGWVGLDSLALIVVYIAAMRLVQTNAQGKGEAIPAEIPEDTPRLRTGILGFLAASTALVIITPFMVSASERIAETTGLGDTFIGSTLVAIVTSLPEMATTIAAIRIGANDMAIGNLFGSNMFNMFALGLTDIFYTPGLFLSAIDPAFLLVSLLGLIMTSMALVGNLARIDKRIVFIEMDALLIALVHFGGLWLLFMRGVSP
jgi:cation:H+ antiporter